MRKKQHRIVFFILGVIILLLLIQGVPYGRNHDSRPIIRELTWDTPGTRIMAKRACFDCHSYETTWPWYSQIAPISWLVQHDVDDGLRKLNFSDWRSGARKGEHPDKIENEIKHDEMPPLLYRLAHPESRLSDTEKRDVINGLSNSIRFPASKSSVGLVPPHL